MDGPGIDEVTRLVQDLITKIGSKREARQNVESLANKVLEQENEKLRVLEEYGGKLEEEKEESNQNMEHNEGDVVIADNERDDDEGRRLQIENLDLRLELQRQQEIENRGNELICEYELAMANIRTSVDGYTRDYRASINWVLESYRSRINEERQVYNELRSSHDRLLFSLAALRETLKRGNDNLGEAINEYQIRLKSDEKEILND